jgi:hypothetical protein
MTQSQSELLGKIMSYLNSNSDVTTKIVNSYPYVGKALDDYNGGRSTADAIFAYLQSNTSSEDIAGMASYAPWYARTQVKSTLETAFLS